MDPTTLDVVLHVGLAFLLGLPIGWEREQRSRSAGLRTYPLLSAGVCGFVLVARASGWDPGDQADVVYGVLGGLAVVGAGAIVTSPEGSRGASTAASLWVTGAVGVGVAFQQPLIAASLSLMTLLALCVPTRHLRRRAQHE